MRRRPKWKPQPDTSSPSLRAKRSNPRFNSGKAGLLRRCAPRHDVLAMTTGGRSAERTPHTLRYLKQVLVLLHQMLPARDPAHRGGGPPPARVQRDEAVEDPLVALAEPPLVVAGADTEI